MNPVDIDVRPGELTLAQIKTVYENEVRVSLGSETLATIEKSANVIEDIIHTGKSVYGVNTGFGLLAQTSIAEDQLSQLQKNLVLSHCTGVGAEIEPAITRVILFLKLNSLACGYSGVSRRAVETLLAFLNHDILPCIPSKGSVGASGDLAPLAHMTAAMMGTGEVRYRGIKMPAEQALNEINLDALQLGPKEGLAFLNGTQVSTGLALTALLKTEYVFAAAIVAGALSVDAMKGSDAPFDPRVHTIRGHEGQQVLAARYNRLLQGSKIRESHVDCEHVQDPYSLRCQPQVMGACLDTLNYCSSVYTQEANAVTDNPLVFHESGDVISGGNFHAQPIAITADTLALAIAETGSLSERRIALLVDPNMSGLPAFLVENSGLNSGFMIAQVTAAALASENKSLAHPASVDNIPTSANQEDHVSMATFAARRLHDMVENTANIIAIELLAAAQGIEFHAPLQTSKELQKVLERIRSDISNYEKDRYFAPDINRCREIIGSGYFIDYMADILPSGKVG